jgi:oxalate decarboxylase/phosphoglucose isomerase-like protein (cupin superfamily)
MGGGNLAERLEEQMKNLNPNEFSTILFDWGRIKWRVSPDTERGASMTAGDVIVFPGKGHSRHNHPDSDELIAVISGTGEQMINDTPPFPISAGSMFYIPKGVYHSTLNTGWDSLVLIVVYTPGGAELALRDLPDFVEIPAGTTPTLSNVR